MAESSNTASRGAYVILSLEDEFAAYDTDPQQCHVGTTTMDIVCALCADEAPLMAAYIHTVHDFYREPLMTRQAFQFMAEAQQQGQPLTMDTHLLLWFVSDAVSPSSHDIVGFTLFHRNPRDSTINVSQCFVSKTARRKKFGTLMLNTLLDTYGTTLNHVKADVPPQSVDALGFFLSSGFELARRDLMPALLQYKASPNGPFIHDGGATIQNRDGSLCMYYYPRHCRHCKKVGGTKRCSGCHRVYYCSEKCQKIEYRMHSCVCNK